ncbi:hypothetical protein NKH77_50550 [Streptomyces sp. M19]
MRAFGTTSPPNSPQAWSSSPRAPCRASSPPKPRAVPEPTSSTRPRTSSGRSSAEPGWIWALAPPSTAPGSGDRTSSSPRRSTPSDRWWRPSWASGGTRGLGPAMPSVVRDAIATAAESRHKEAGIAVTEAESYLDPCPPLLQDPQWSSPVPVRPVRVRAHRRTHDTANLPTFRDTNKPIVLVTLGTIFSDPRCSPQWSTRWRATTSTCSPRSGRR